MGNGDTLTSSSPPPDQPAERQPETADAPQEAPSDPSAGAEWAAVAHKEAAEPTTAPEQPPPSLPTADQPALAQAANPTDGPSAAAAVTASTAPAHEAEPISHASERQASLVLRPVAQRLGPPMHSGELQAESPATAGAAGLPLSPSESLPLEKSTSIPHQQQTPEGSPGSIGWFPRKSAWTPYRSKPEQPHPAASESGQPKEEPERSGQPGRPEMPAAASSSAALPVQSSLDVLHDAAFSAAEGFFQQHPSPQQPAAAATNEAEHAEEPSAFFVHGEDLLCI